MADKEYIERGAAKEPFGAETILARSIRKILDEVPAADVVEVVRCKDCVSSRPLRRNDRFEALFVEGCVYCMKNDDGVDNEHFCGYGERKEDNR